MGVSIGVIDQCSISIIESNGEVWQKVRFAGLVAVGDSRVGARRPLVGTGWICHIRGRRGIRRRTNAEGHMLASRSAATAQEKFALLNAQRLPGRLNTSEAALLLGFQEHDIALLVAAKLLVPLGKPAPNAPKYFAAVQIADRASDCEWLSDATKQLAKHWFRKNQRKSAHARSAVQCTGFEAAKA
jgi:hypothetical protein